MIIYFEHFYLYAQVGCRALSRISHGPHVFVIKHQSHQFFDDVFHLPFLGSTARFDPETPLF